MEVVGSPYDRIEVIDNDYSSIFFSTNSRNFDRIFYDLRKVIYELKNNDVLKRRVIKEAGETPFLMFSNYITNNIMRTIVGILCLDSCSELKDVKKFVDTLVQKYFEYYEYYEKEELLCSDCHEKGRNKTVEYFKSILENQED